MDDMVLVEPALGLRHKLSEMVAEESIVKILGPAAINKEKNDLEGRPETQKRIWGLTYGNYNIRFQVHDNVLTVSEVTGL